MYHKVEISRYPVDPAVITAAEGQRMQTIVSASALLINRLLLTAQVQGSVTTSALWAFLQVVADWCLLRRTRKVHSPMYIKCLHAATIQHVLVIADKRFLATFRIRRGNFGRKQLNFLK